MIRSLEVKVLLVGEEDESGVVLSTGRLQRRLGVGVGQGFDPALSVDHDLGLDLPLRRPCDVPSLCSYHLAILGSIRCKHSVKWQHLSWMKDWLICFRKKLYFEQ